MPLEELIDGPTQTDKCGPTPSGPAWAVMRDQDHIAGSFVRLAYIDDRSTVIDIFNVNPTANHERLDMPIIAGLVAAVPPPEAAGLSRYYPPLMIGDLNKVSIDQIPGFHPLFQGKEEQTGIGDAERYSARYRARVAEAMLMPDVPSAEACYGTPDILVSDHCALFVRFEKDGEEADKLRSVTIDGPISVTSGAPFSLNATVAGGGGRLLTYRWEPGGATKQRVEAQAPAAGITQTWRVTVSDGLNTVSDDHSVQSLPDPSACEEACADSCNADVPRTGGPLGPQCAIIVKACQKHCRAGNP
jgi:hypothetical protein